MTSFPNHILKLQPARHHLDDLRSMTEHWFNGDHHSTRLELNPNNTSELLITASVDPIPTDPFSLVISDVIQNFRGCLEHLAFDALEDIETYLIVMVLPTLSRFL